MSHTLLGANCPQPSFSSCVSTSHREVCSKFAHTMCKTGTIAGSFWADKNASHRNMSQADIIYHIYTETRVRAFCSEWIVCKVALLLDQGNRSVVQFMSIKYCQDEIQWLSTHTDTYGRRKHVYYRQFGNMRYTETDRQKQRDRDRQRERERAQVCTWVCVCVYV